ncbi:hypothetical protein RB195_007889 [Necator americanus]|uniref:Uncharacterized protein n=1 Tax=Necator americanus TaxID=51031 RepID=A0ABR1C216_NECAM
MQNPHLPSTISLGFRRCSSSSDIDVGGVTPQKLQIFALSAAYPVTGFGGNREKTRSCPSSLPTSPPPPPPLPPPPPPPPHYRIFFYTFYVCNISSSYTISSASRTARDEQYLMGGAEGGQHTIPYNHRRTRSFTR